MRSAKKTTRTKLAATVSPETYAFLEQMVNRGEAATFSEALDKAVSQLQRLENRKCLADATARYFEGLDPQSSAAENEIAKDMMLGAAMIDFDE